MLLWYSLGFFSFFKKCWLYISVRHDTFWSADISKELKFRIPTISSFSQLKIIWLGEVCSFRKCDTLIKNWGSQMVLEFSGEWDSSQTFAYLNQASLAQQEWEDVWMLIWCIGLLLSLTTIHEGILFLVVTMDVTIQKNITFSHYSVTQDDREHVNKSGLFCPPEKLVWTNLLHWRSSVT